MEHLEDLEDLQAVRNAKAKKEEAFPMRLYGAIDAGEHPIRAFRNYRKLSVRKLASMADISETYLSQIESGVRKGTTKTCKAIAKALNVPVSEIIN